MIDDEKGSFEKENYKQDNVGRNKNEHVSLKCYTMRQRTKLNDSTQGIRGYRSIEAHDNDVSVKKEQSGHAVTMCQIHIARHK